MTDEIYYYMGRFHSQPESGGLKDGVGLHEVDSITHLGIVLANDSNSHVETL